MKTAVLGCSARSLAAAVGALACIVYANALLAGFVWDDQLMVLQNPWLPHLSSLPSIFTSSEVGYRADIQANYYRPLKNVAYVLTYQLAGLRPWAYHALNVLAHAGASVLVFVLCRRVVVLGTRSDQTIASGQVASFAAACIFAVHPIHTEPVMWVAALPEVGYTLFGLISLAAHSRWREAPQHHRWYVASIASFIVALFWKEPAVAFLPILVVLDWTLGRRRLEERAAAFAPHAIIVLLYVLIRSSALGGFLPSQGHRDMTFVAIVLNAVTLFGRYLHALVVPWPLNSFHAFKPVEGAFDSRLILSAITTLLFAAAVVFALVKRHRVFVLAACLITLPLLPVLYSPGVGENAFTERYLYLPSVGFAFLLALAFVEIAALPGRAVMIALASGVSLVIIVFSGMTLTRNRAWRDDESLWSDSAKKSPAAFIPQAAMGDLLMRARRFADAVPYYQRALGLAPGVPGATESQRRAWERDMHNNLGVAFSEMGSLGIAEQHLNAALALDPRAAETHNNLGRLASKTGDPKRAINHFRMAVELSDAPPEGVYRNLAAAYFAAGMPAEGAAVLRAIGR